MPVNTDLSDGKNTPFSAQLISIEYFRRIALASAAFLMYQLLYDAQHNHNLVLLFLKKLF